MADEGTCWLLGHVVSGASSLFRQHMPGSVLADESVPARFLGFCGLETCTFPSLVMADDGLCLYPAESGA
jgi:hypothetical protein